MKFFATLALCATCLTVTSGASQAATVSIDTFDNTNFQVVGAPTLGNNPTNPATTSGPTSDAIGGVRTITVTRTVPGGTDDAFGAQVQAVVTNGEASVSVASGVEGTAEFFWNAGGADLTGGGMNDRLLIDVLTADLGGSIVYSFFIDGISASSSVVSAPGTLEFLFSSFGGADFTDVTNISLLIEGPAAFDTSFDNVRAGAGTPVVPLPAGLPLLLAGIGAFAVLRRRST